LSRRRPPRRAEDGGRAGGDAKLLAVPIDKILPWYRAAAVVRPRTGATGTIQHSSTLRIGEGKWVKVIGWEG
jgi:inorganic pyrophosphatase